MIFLHPEFLYYMLPVLVILFALLLTQKESQATFFSDEVMSKLRVSSNTLTLKARNALFFLVSVLVVIALADPVIKDGKVEIKEKSADIMLALDISDSMLAEDVYPNRLKFAKQKALDLLRLAPNERIGVIAFAKNSYLVSPLSFDHDAVRFLLSNLSTDSITEQGTNFMSMLNVVNKSIKNDAHKYLLILSDGGDKKDFSKEIAFAKKHNIVVYILGIGSKQGAPIKMSNGEFIKQNGKIIISKLNENIASLATKSGGVYIQSVIANDDVKAMLKEIEAHSKKKELKSQQIEKYIPLFYYPLGLALLILLIATSSMSKRVQVKVPAAFIATFFLSHVSNLNATVLDFMDLKEAKKAYEQKEYEKSAQLYDNYAKSSQNGASYYNAGNAFYKKGEYKQALQNYKKAQFSDVASRAKNFANIGNTYVKMGTEANLKKAVEFYEDSLKLKEDKDVRENLEAVKKALKKKKEQKQNKSNKNKKNNKKNDKKNQQNKKNKQDNNKNSSKDKNKSKQEKNKEKKNKGSQGEKDKKQDMKSKKQSEDEAKSQKEQQKKNEQQKQNRADKNKKEKQKPQKPQELKEKANKGDKSAQKKAQNAVFMKDKMSDAEEKKWLKKLNQQQKSYLYMLNNNQKNQENTNEKPW